MCPCVMSDIVLLAHCCVPAASPTLVVYQLNVSVIYQRIADMAYQLHIRLYQVAYQVDISSRAYQAVSGAYQLDMHLISRRAPTRRDE